jgi:hypothetical protein
VRHSPFLCSHDKPTDTVINFEHNLQKRCEGALIRKSHYGFLREQYPAATEIPDLAAQVRAFLSLKKPKYSPRETVWVFSFGAWDVWSLAALPQDQAKDTVDALVLVLFSQVEVLYEQSLQQNSVAFSDFWEYSDTSVLEKLNDPNQTATVSPFLRENFRVLIPELFDISLTPGWHDLRPAPPGPHSKAEQMRNAAFLTSYWNRAINRAMFEWVRTSEWNFNATADAEVKSWKSLLKYLPSLTGSKDEGASLLVPYPPRMGAQYGLPGFIEAIREQQLRQAEIADHARHGSRPANASIRFNEVWEPCVRDGVSGESVAGKSDQKDEESAKDGEGSRMNGTTTCDTPDDYLFFSPFTVAERAKREIGLQAARLVTRELAMGDEPPTLPARHERRGSKPGFVYLIR